MTRTTDLGQETVDNILKRLRRIEGQVRGLQKMVAEGRPCDEVLTQMTATKKAMEAAATLILHEFLNVCAAEVSEGKVNPKKPEEIATASAQADGLLGGYRFRPGNTYAEFLPGKDSVAELGLKGLILGGAGAALIKSGLLGKFWKVIVAGVVGLGAGISRLLGRKKDAGVGPTPT